jgi:hypothetical protein
VSDLDLDLAEIIDLPESLKGLRLRPRRRVRKFAKNWAWMGQEVPAPELENMEKKIFLGASDFEDYIKSEVVKRRFDMRKPTLFREIHVLTNRKEWAAWSEEFYEDHLIIEYNSSSGMILNEHTDDLLQYYVNSNSIEVRAYGNAEFLEETEIILSKRFSVVGASIEWVFTADGRSVDVPLNKDRLPIQEMYPFLNEPLADYYRRFMDSTANILLLIGPPGTGKTTFIRGLLAQGDLSAMVTYDDELMRKDSLFARFVEGDASVMVIEDSDTFLRARTDGNTMMHRFLNVGDGLVTTKGKKLIFSTNLPSTKDIDPALIRPGRCFDVLNFNLLNKEQAKVLAKKVGSSLPEKDKDGANEYSIAEIYNQKADDLIEKKTKKFGFV